MAENLKEKEINLNKPARLIKKEPWQENPNEWIIVTLSASQLASCLHKVKKDGTKAVQIPVKLPRPMVPLELHPQSGPEQPEYKPQEEAAQVV